MSTVERPLRKDAERNRQRILDAAAELFTERGLGVTLNDIAHHAGCGVGTVYRRFPDKEQLIDALFEERVSEMVVVAQDALANPDPWEGLRQFLEDAIELQARSQALKELMLDTPEGCAQIRGVRDRLTPIVRELVERAKAAGVLRPDIEHQDLAAIHIMLGAVIDRARDVRPELWRRYLELVLRGMQAGPVPDLKLSVEALDGRDLDTVLQTH